MTVVQTLFQKTTFNAYKLAWFGKKRTENLNYSLKLIVIEGESF